MSRGITALLDLHNVVAPGANVAFGAFTVPVPKGRERGRVVLTIVLELDGDLRMEVTRAVVVAPSVAGTITAAFQEGNTIQGGAWYAWILPVSAGDAIVFKSTQAGQVLRLLVEQVPEGSDA